MSGKFLQASVVIKSLRDSGYNNAASALGELIDNSIQAGASIVELGIIEEISSSTRRNNFVATEITLWDNGKGEFYTFFNPGEEFLWIETKPGYDI